MGGLQYTVLSDRSAYASCYKLCVTGDMAMLDWCPPGVLVGIVQLEVPESHTAGQCESIGDAGLRFEGWLRIRCDQHALSHAVLVHYGAVMAVDGGCCCVLLARSLASQSVLIELVKATCFLCVVNQWPLGPIDPWLRGGLRAWVVHSPGAPTAMAAINAFLCEVRWRVLVNMDHLSLLRRLWALSDSILVKSHRSISIQAQKKKKKNLYPTPRYKT